MQDYEKMGYSRDDLVGRSGVEATMESELTGNIKQRQGYRIVEVNNRGKVTREIETVSAQAGNNVILSIDSKLQKQLEEALEKNIQKVRQMQQEQYETNKGEYESLVQARGYPINMAETGAAVVMDIHTGEILAMASYPSYDPNNFVDGISHEEYATIEQDKRYPLMNKAISSKGTPGSVFKMLTGLAGLMEGKVKVDEEIDDAGEYRKHVDESYKGKVPSCWVRPNFYLHKQEDIVKALKDSCNYYFYEVSSRLGIDLLTKWSDMLGLTSKTGIELPGEAVGQTANQEVLLKTSIRALVSQRIKELIKQRTGIAYNDDLLNTVVNELLELYSDSTPGPIIRQILKEKLNITSAQVRSDLGAEIAGYLTEIRWDPNKTIVAGIGQSVTTLTPIGVTRYIAALVNGGKVMEAHVVKQVTDPEGNVILDKEPVVVRDLDIPDLYLEKIKEGMREVISLEDGGTAAKEFKDFEYKDDIGGKTGTAQVSNIDLENNAWFVAFAPFDKPEIAVTVFIPNGYKGAYAAETVKEIVQLYMDRKMKTGTESIPAFSELVP